MEFIIYLHSGSFDGKNPRVVVIKTEYILFVYLSGKNDCFLLSPAC